MSGGSKPFHVHATTVSVDGRGVMIRGKPGSGKSELALRLIDNPGFGVGEALLRARLVADDQTRLEVIEGALWASPPEALAGLLELRGQGLLSLPHVAPVRLSLVVDLLPPEGFERMPEPADLETEIAGVVLPRIPLDPGEAAAPAVVRAILSGGQLRDAKSLP